MKPTPPSTSIAPTKTSGIVDKLIIQAFAKLDKIALGAAVGALCGLVVFAATIILRLRGGENVGQNLSLLGQYFIGYTVTWKGSFIGLAYGFVTGFIMGFFLALLRNFSLAVYLFFVRRKAELAAFNDFFDNL